MQCRTHPTGTAIGQTDSLTRHEKEGAFTIQMTLRNRSPLTPFGAAENIAMNTPEKTEANEQKIRSKA